MRLNLWPGCLDEHVEDIERFFHGDSTFIDQVFVCETEDGDIVGFLELRIRDYAEGGVGLTAKRLRFHGTTGSVG